MGIFRNDVSLDEGIELVRPILESPYFGQYVLKDSEVLSDTMELHISGHMPNGEPLYLGDMSTEIRNTANTIISKEMGLRDIKLNLRASDDIRKNFHFFEGCDNPYDLSLGVWLRNSESNLYTFSAIPGSYFLEEDRGAFSDEVYRQNKGRFSRWSKEVNSKLLGLIEKS